MKPLIIGEAPSKNEHVPRPISGRIGRRLAACAGMDFERFLESFDRVNLLHVRQDTKEKGFEFDEVAAKAAALAITSNGFARNRPAILLLGKRVMRAFEVEHPYFEEFRVSGSKTFVVPHPSGVNRWYNDDANMTLMRSFMERIAMEYGL